MRQQQTLKSILVLGAGSWGTALAILLEKNGNPTRLWSYDAAQADMLNTTRENSRFLPGIKIPEGIIISNNLNTLMQGVDDILIVVPSFAFSETLKKLKAIRPTGLRIAWGTKGLEPTTHHMLHDVVADIFSADIPMAVLSGPSFAKEVARSLPTAVSLAGNNDQFNQDLLARFHSGTFRVYLNKDITGVELCGVVKNVLAIAVGISDGIGFGANTRSVLITRGLAEMKNLCLAVGGDAKTLMSLAGIGDLVLTCTDDQSRNRRFGLALGRNLNIAAAQQEIGQAIEGYSNAQQLYELAKQYQVDMPIVKSLYNILYNSADIKEEVLTLMSRDPKME